MYTNVTEHKNKLYVTELKNGVTTYHKIDNFKPTLFAETYNESEYKGFPKFNNLERLVFNNIKEYKDYSFQMKDIKDSYYGNISSEYQYIYQYYGKTDIENPRTHMMDIETNVEDEFPDPELAEEPITFLQIYDNIDNHITIFHWLMDYTRPLNSDVTIHKCSSEREMIDMWLNYYYEKKPHLVLGWNFISFDLRYLTNRLANLDYKSGILSPFNKTETKKYKVYDKDIEIEYPIGVTWMAYDDIFYAHAYIKTPDKKLDTAANVVLGIGEGKLEWKRYFKSFKDMAHQVYSPPLDITSEEKEELIYKLYIARNNFPVNSPDWIKLDKAMHQEAYNIFTDYSILDVRLLKDMDNKIKMASLAFGYAWAMGINPSDVLGTIKPWTNLLYGEFLDNNIVIPTKIEGHEFYKPIGGLWDANPGLYKWIMSQDFTSLYPLNAVALNMSPETIIHFDETPVELQELVQSFRRFQKDGKWYDREDNMDIYINLPEEHKEDIRILAEKYNFTMSTNGIFFSKERKGMLPIIIEKIFSKRKEYKKLMKDADNDNDKARYNILQMTEKIKINSLYGALGNKHFCIGISDIAAAITAFGRYNLQTLCSTGNTLHRELTGEDIIVTNKATDAGYFVFDKVVDKAFKDNPLATDKEKAIFLDNLNKQIFNPRINDNIEYNLKLHNGYINVMNCDREVIASRGLVTGISRYALRVIDDEGKLLDEPKMKVIGMPNINMTIPLKIRKSLDEVINIMFDNNNNSLIDYISEYKKEFYKYKPHEISMKSGVSSINKYIVDEDTKDEQVELFGTKTKGTKTIDKGIYWVSKASIIYNDLLHKYKLEEEFESIQENDKVMVIYLKRNPITQAEVLAYKDELFLEKIGLKEYINYDKHFEKLFIEAVKTFAEIVNWGLKKSSVVKKLF